MAIPLLDYSLQSQNQRVQGFEVAGDEHSFVYSTENLLSSAGIDALINAAYLQVFREQQMLKRNRQTFLESQLRNGQITVREFVRGLVLSEPFRRNNYNSNSNYRFVELCLQRLLGRAPHGDRELQAWSIVLATKGIQGFVDALLDGEEYAEQFGDDVVPFQRRRILPSQAAGELPYQRMPRYSADYRIRLENMGMLAKDGFGEGGALSTWTGELPPQWARRVGGAVTIAGATTLIGLVGAIALAAFGWISL